LMENNLAQTFLAFFLRAVQHPDNSQLYGQKQNQ